MHSVTDRRHDYANSRSYCAEVRSAKIVDVNVFSTKTSIHKTIDQNRRCCRFKHGHDRPREWVERGNWERNRDFFIPISQYFKIPTQPGDAFAPLPRCRWLFHHRRWSGLLCCRYQYLHGTVCPKMSRPHPLSVFGSPQLPQGFSLRGSFPWLSSFTATFVGLVPAQCQWQLSFSDFNRSFLLTYLLTIMTASAIGI